MSEEQTKYKLLIETPERSNIILCLKASELKKIIFNVASEFRSKWKYGSGDNKTRNVWEEPYDLLCEILNEFGYDPFSD